jgi:transcriptional regulator with GAF, ATPase, and Fis domain
VADLTFNPWAFEGEVVEIVDRDKQVEKGRILEALQQSKGNQTQAARNLGMPRSSLLYRMKKHGIKVT